MQKDIIYIDIEDDITAIIGKIKASKEKIVALVPPKRIGVLQSAVNLKLLARTAEHSHKHLVIVTSNKALIALSAVAMIPIAKNLQSKPELAEIDEDGAEETEDIIDGSSLPVGDLVKTVDSNKNTDEISDIIGSIDVENEVTRLPKSHTKPKNEVKIPDFSNFRKKLFFGVALGIGLIVFLVWATQTAPAATVIITTKTSDAPVSMALTLSGTQATDTKKNTIQTVVKQIKKDASVEFDATGQSDVGDKATGIISIENCDIEITIAANTVFTSSSGKRFVSSESAVVPGLGGSPSVCRNTGAGAGTADIKVVAEKPGTSYNINATYYSIAGVSGDVYANGSDMTGGTTRMATVVSAEDIQKAGEKLAAQSSDNIKSQLTNQFTNGEYVISDSFTVEHATAVSSPLVGVESKTGKATLTSATTYTLTAIAKSELQIYLKEVVAKQIDDAKLQRVYDDGAGSAKLTGYLKTDTTSTINVTATGKIGPNIDTNFIKEQVKGKRYGEIQSLISSMKGVSNVDIKFSYFWVTSAPNDKAKIEVEFKLEDGKSS